MNKYYGIQFVLDGQPTFFNAIIYTSREKAEKEATQDVEGLKYSSYRIEELWVEE